MAELRETQIFLLLQLESLTGLLGRVAQAVHCTIRGVGSHSYAMSGAPLELCNAEAPVLNLYL